MSSGGRQKKLDQLADLRISVDLSASLPSPPTPPPMDMIIEILASKNKHRCLVFPTTSPERQGGKAGA